MLAVLLAMTAPGVRAAGFGEVQVASQLGERLYARVPLVGEGAAEIATECVRLIPESVLQDAPALSNARIGIDRRSSPPAVVVSTPAPVMEPAVRFVLEMGCGNRFRREFVLLIDPPDLPAVQTAGTPGPVVAPVARVIPADEPRWGSSAAGGIAPPQSTTPPPYDAPLAEPPVKAAPPPRKAAPKPRPKPAAVPQVADQRKPAAAPPPTRAPEPPKPATTDRLVLADTDPAASQPVPTPEQAARDAREEALTKQVEALTKEVARMREDMDKLSARNRELVKEAESRTGWFAAAGLGIVLAGVGLGLLGRREKKPSWRDNLGPVGGAADASFTPPSATPTDAREEAPEPKAAAMPVPSYRTTTMPDPVTDLDVTKLDVRETTGLHGTIMNTTSAAGTTMFPSDLAAGTTLGPSGKPSPLQSLDFSLDDFDIQPSTGGRPSSPVFTPAKPATGDESEAARAALFEEIEKAHRATKKG